VVLKVDGEVVERAWQLKRALARRHADDVLELEVRRGTETRTVKVKLASPPAPPDAPTEPHGHEEEGR
jgi:S1-C subfamily serine protease